MAYVCIHCQGDHVSNRCPTFPQFCTNCNEEHPFGTECYLWSAVVEDDTSEVDAEIAREEAEKVLLRKARVSSKREKTYGWRERNPEAYRAYMRDYMRKWRKR